MSHLLCTTLLTLGNIPGHNPEHFHFLRAISYSGTRSSSPFREGTWRCSACSVSMQGTIFHWYILLRMQQTHLQDLHKPTWTSGLILPNGSIFQETVQSQIFFFFVSLSLLQSKVQNSTILMGKSNSWIIIVIKFLYWEKWLIAYWLSLCFQRHL